MPGRVGGGGGRQHGLEARVHRVQGDTARELPTFGPRYIKLQGNVDPRLRIEDIMSF